MPLFIMDPADSVNIYAWDDLLGGHTDFLNHLPIFHYLSMFDVHCWRYSWYLNQVILPKHLISCNFTLVKGLVLYVLVHHYHLYVSAS